MLSKSIKKTENKNYELEEFPKPFVTVDVIVFTIKSNKLSVLLVKRKIPPFQNSWSIPGGFVDVSQSLEDAAKFKLFQKTNVKDIYLEQLYTFGEPKRDPRGRVITVTYFALIKSESVFLDDAAWFDVSELPNLAFDHKEIVDYALKRLKWKFEYTVAGFSLIPNKFTLTQLQEVYETVFNKEFDKRNFRKKILSLNILEEKGVMSDVAFRPPKIYSLKKKVPDFVNII